VGPPSTLIFVLFFYLIFSGARQNFTSKMARFEMRLIMSFISMKGLIYVSNIQKRRQFMR
jgi:hypothetical protein